MKTVYFEKVKHLLAEMFAMKKRKAMHKALNVFTFIVTLPFFVVFLLLSLFLLMFVVLFETLETPAKYLDEFLSKRGDDVKTATQVIVYFFAWPVVFALKAMIAFVTLFMNIFYVLVVMVGYVWTLGGVKFHLSILEEGYELEEQEKITKGRPLGLLIPGLIFLVLTIVMFVLFALLPSLKMGYYDESGAVQTTSLLCYLTVLLAPMLFGTNVSFTTASFATFDTSAATYNDFTIACLTVYSLFLIIAVVVLAVYAAYVALYVPLAFNNGKKQKETEGK